MFDMHLASVADVRCSMGMDMKYTGLTSKSIDLWGDTTAKLKVVNVRSNFLDENILTRIYVCCSYYCFFI